MQMIPRAKNRRIAAAVKHLHPPRPIPLRPAISDFGRLGRDFSKTRAAGSLTGSGGLPYGWTGGRVCLVIMAKVHDIAVLGATAEGFAAAYALARNGCDVVAASCPAGQVACPLTDWVPRGSLALPGLPRGLIGKAGAVAFKQVRYHSADLARQVEITGKVATGHFVPAGAITDALRLAAARAGAKRMSFTDRPAVEIHEDHVCLRGRRNLRAALLILAQDAPAEAGAQLGAPQAGGFSPGLHVAGLDVPVPGQANVGLLRGPLHVVEMPAKTDIGMFFLAGRVLHVRSISRAGGRGAAIEALTGMLSALRSARVFPANLPVGRARGAVWRPPGGAALELETHLAKHCLLAGTAGGFVDSSTGQTLRPGLQSSLLAAEAAGAALRSDDRQAALGEFRSTWRRRLARYIRPPSTPLQMLFPLLFANRRIVRPFTAALLCGGDI